MRVVLVTGFLIKLRSDEYFILAIAIFVMTRIYKKGMNSLLRLLEDQMSNFNDFQKMINSLNKEKLSELCEEFLTNHEAAMNILFKYCSDFGLIYDSQEIKDNMTIMHNNGDFDNIVCFGIELSENQLYKKFHPS